MFWAMDGRTVLVTGTTSGIGRVTASALGRGGAIVLVHERDSCEPQMSPKNLRALAGVCQAISDRSLVFAPSLNR